MQLAENLGIRALQYHPEKLNWNLIAEKLLGEPVTNISNRPPRFAEVVRKTKETDIKVQVWLDETGVNENQKPALVSSTICLTKSPLTVDSA